MDLAQSDYHMFGPLQEATARRYASDHDVRTRCIRAFDHSQNHLSSQTRSEGLWTATQYAL